MNASNSVWSALSSGSAEETREAKRACRLLALSFSFKQAADLRYGVPSGCRNPVLCDSVAASAQPLRQTAFAFLRLDRLGMKSNVYFRLTPFGLRILFSEADWEWLEHRQQGSTGRWYSVPRDTHFISSRTASDLSAPNPRPRYSSWH